MTLKYSEGFLFVSFPIFKNKNGCVLQGFERRAPTEPNVSEICQNGSKFVQDKTYMRPIEILQREIYNTVYAKAA
jgi:hypothetical protein